MTNYEIMPEVKPIRMTFNQWLIALNPLTTFQITTEDGRVYQGKRNCHNIEFSIKAFYIPKKTI